MKTCGKCQAEFETGPELGAHFKAEHSQKESTQKWIPYRCFSCPGLFYDHMEYNQHRHEHHTLKGKAIVDGVLKEVSLVDASFWNFFYVKHGAR